MNQRDQFLKLYQPLHQRLCAYIQAMVRNREDARDMIAEVTLLALEKFHTLRDESRFLFFLFGIARNLYAEKLRYNKRFSHSLPETEDEKWATHTTTDNWELQHLLNMLNAEEKQRLVLFSISGFSYKEIAELTGEPEHKVKSGLYETRQKLKTFLRKESETLQKMEKEIYHGN